MNETPPTLVSFLPALTLAFLGFAVFWCLISFFISRMSGWAALARAYPAGQILAPNGKWAWQSARMNITKYNGAVTVVADAQAVHFSVFPLLRPGHARFSVPWEDIRATPRQLALAQRVQLTFARAPAVTMLVWPSLAERLTAASQGRLASGL